jgi:carbonic anhydrase
MSCNNSTSPINISLTNITGKCDLKCLYSFNYTSSNCVVKNMKTYLALSYDSSNVAPVTYNTNKYNVSQIRIYTPSLHAFNDNRADAEMVIIHTPETSGKPLIVCIPIRKLNSSTTASNLLTDIIDKTATNAPNQGESINTNLDNFTLNTFIPYKPFFSYTGTTFLSSCDEVNFIVYGLMSALEITPDSLDKLQSIISSHSIKTQSNSFFLNESGPSSTASSDQIYIDCQPTGSSTEETEVTTDKNTSTIKLDDVLNSEIFKMFLASVIFIIIIMLIFQGLKYISVVDVNTDEIKAKIISKVQSIRKPKDLT